MNATNTQAEEYMTPQEVADLLRVPLQTLRTWRKANKGPLGLRIGRHLRFPRADVEAWAEALRDEARSERQARTSRVTP